MSRQRPLKVLHLASGDRWAGAEVQLYTLLTQLHQMPCIEVRAVLLNEGELAKRLRTQGIVVDVLDESRLASSAIFAGMVRLLRKHRPDVLHTHRLKENILGAVANLISIRARSVRTVHGAPEQTPRSLPQRIIQALNHWTGNYLQQRIIAVSDDLAAKLAQTFTPDLIVVIENGVDIEAVRTAVEPVDFRVTDSEAVHIGIIGRLDPVKRVDIFLDMAALLLREHPQQAWRFHVFGEGALENQLKSEAQSLGITAAVSFHGHRSDIASCLAGLDAVVMCSDHEGLPMTVLEALAVGTPMVAHAVGGLAKVLKGNVGGVLITEHTPAGYARGLANLIANDRHSMREHGFKRVHDAYSARRNAERIVDVYTQLLPPPF